MKFSKSQGVRILCISMYIQIIDRFDDQEVDVCVGGTKFLVNIGISYIQFTKGIRLHYWPSIHRALEETGIPVVTPHWGRANDLLGGLEYINVILVCRE